MTKFYKEIIDTLHSPAPLVIGLILFGMALLNLDKIIRLGKLSKYFNGHLNWYCFLIPSFAGETIGLKFRIWTQNKSHYSAGFLYIFLYKNSFYKLKVSKKNFVGQMTFKIMGLKEAFTDDPEFNQEFSIYTDNPGIADNYLNSEKKRDQIRDLLDGGFYLFSIDRKYSALIKIDPNFKEDLDPQKLKAVIEGMRDAVAGF